jgi:FMN phosphatase YigB (HAD superfamily)
MKLAIFDMGGVVIRDFAVDRKMASLLGVDYEDFMVEYRHYDFPLMDGTVSEGQFYSHLEHVFGLKVPGNPFGDLFRPILNAPIVQLMSKMRSAMPDAAIVCGSNTIKSHWDYLEQKGWLRLFDRAYASHLLGVSKPQRAFFETIVKSEGVKMSDAVFIDDYQENIDGARRCGLEAVLYRPGFESDLSSELGLGL